MEDCDKKGGSGFSVVPRTNTLFGGICVTLGALGGLIVAVAKSGADVTVALKITETALHGVAIVVALWMLGRFLESNGRANREGLRDIRQEMNAGFDAVTTAVRDLETAHRDEMAESGRRSQPTILPPPPAPPARQRMPTPNPHR